MKVRLIIGSIILLGLVACAGGPAGTVASKPVAGKPVAAADEPAATVRLPRAHPPLFIAFEKSCAISKTGNTESPIAAILLGSLLKPLVETAVPAATGWLYDRGVHALAVHNAKLQSSSTAVTTTMLYNVAENKYSFGCVMLVRAARGSMAADAEDYYRQERGGITRPAETSNWRRDTAVTAINELSISRVPEFYLELAFESISAGTEKDEAVLDTMPSLLAKGKVKLTEEEKTMLVGRKARRMYRTITPQRLDYFASGAERINDGVKNVSVEVHFEALDVNGDWKPFYTKTYDFGKLKVGSEAINLTSLGTDLFVPPAPRHTPDGYRDPIPVRVTALLTESDDNSDLGRTLETAFRAAQARKATVDAVAKVVIDKMQAKIDEKSGAAGPAGK